MKSLLALLFAGTTTMLSGCTLSINVVKTVGTAKDVIDETQSPRNDLKGEATVPLKAL